MWTITLHPKSFMKARSVLNTLLSQVLWMQCSEQYKDEDASLPRRYQIKLLHDRCKIITSGSLQSVNLGHDNSYIEMLGIL